MRHALLDSEHIVTLGHDVRLAQAEAPLQRRFDLLIRIAFDLDLDDAVIHRLLEVLADRRAIDAHALGNLTLLHVVEVVHASRLDQDALLHWHHDDLPSSVSAPH